MHSADYTHSLEDTQRAIAAATLWPDQVFSEFDPWFIEYKKSFETDGRASRTAAPVPEQLDANERVDGNNELYVGAHAYVKGLVLAMCRAFRRGELGNLNHTEDAAEMKAVGKLDSAAEAVGQLERQ